MNTTQLAADLDYAQGLPFWFMHREPRGSWEWDQSESLSLEKAFKYAGESNAPIRGIMVRLPSGGGIIYWTSNDPGLLNSTCLTQAKMMWQGFSPQVLM